ncbi:MAG TPA: hypothetical protein VGT05_05260 [Patescibacteria group bacterium]|nr:hypothetical protein [Patescibacteria group bacterium]
MTLAAAGGGAVAEGTAAHASHDMMIADQIFGASPLEAEAAASAKMAGQDDLVLEGARQMAIHHAINQSHMDLAQEIVTNRRNGTYQVKGDLEMQDRTVPLRLVSKNNIVTLFTEDTLPRESEEMYSQERNIIPIRRGSIALPRLTEETKVA